MNHHAHCLRRYVYERLGLYLRPKLLFPLESLWELKESPLWAIRWVFLVSKWSSSFFHLTILMPSIRLPGTSICKFRMYQSAQLLQCTDGMSECQEQNHLRIPKLMKFGSRHQVAAKTSIVKLSICWTSVLGVHWATLGRLLLWSWPQVLQEFPSSAGES